MKEEFDHIEELIGKVLAGEASEKERTQVEEWVALKTANRKYFTDLQLIFDRSKTINVNQRFDADKAWLAVKARISKSKGRTIAFPQYWTAFRIAAALLIAAGLGFFTYQWFSPPDQVMAIASEGKILTDTLPDGSLAVLNKGSSIDYVYNTNNNKRKVVLKGEAFFEVKHEEDKPFIIETAGVIIEDIGTAFNVTAYPDSPTVEVYVESGQVAFYTINSAGLNLVAGETGVYNKSSQAFARLVKTDTNRLAYKTGIFSFRNADLQTIIQDLNSVYERKIKLGNDALKTCRLNVAFRNEKIEDIAEIIAETLKLTLTIDGNDFVLNGASCGD